MGQVRVCTVAQCLQCYSRPTVLKKPCWQILRCVSVGSTVLTKPLLAPTVVCVGRFDNDGSFMEKFMAMQKAAAAKKRTAEDDAKQPAGGAFLPGRFSVSVCMCARTIAPEAHTETLPSASFGVPCWLVIGAYHCYHHTTSHYENL